MNPRELIDPELLSVLEILSVRELSEATLSLRRAEIAELAASFPSASEPRIAFAEACISGGAGQPNVRVLTYRPVDAPVPGAAILHIHGGGYVLGTADMSHAANQALAAELGCVVVSVDYRLAPETPHPGPIEDCYAALRWLHENSRGLGVDVTRVGVSGESAGGGLAAALALLARDRGELAVAFQHLIAPMIDDRTAVATDPHVFAGKFVWTPELNLFGWQSLLGPIPVGGADVSPYAAAARATDLSGLPRCFISIGALDLFLDESLDYCRRLSRAGVQVEMHVYPGAVHGFQVAANARVSRVAMRDSFAALRQFIEL